jgi:hypothetical protein
LEPFGFSGFGSRTDHTTATGDFYPMINLRCNEGVNNFMPYISGHLPFGEYDATGSCNVGGAQRRESGICATAFGKDALRNIFFVVGGFLGEHF